MNKVENKVPEGFKITGNWPDQARALKDKFGGLTDADLKYEPGKELELLQRLQIKLNKKREEIVNIINKGQSKP